MKHQDIILTQVEKLEQQRKIDRFLEQNYCKLVLIAKSKLHRYGITHIEAEDLVGDLYPILDRLAFVHEGWAGEEDVLRQSIARIDGFSKDAIQWKAKAVYLEDQDTGYLERRYCDNYDLQESVEESLIKAEVIAGAYKIAGDDPYRLALMGIWSGELTVNQVAEEYKKHKSTVSHDKADLMLEIRDYILREGLA